MATFGQTFGPPAYLQGTWTPAVQGTSTPGTGQTYSTLVGSYEQIGRLVIARFNIIVTSLGTAAGNIQIAGLPFTPAPTTNDNGHVTIGLYTVASTTGNGLTGNIPAGGSVIRIYQNVTTTSGSLTIAQAGAAFTIEGTAIYRTA